MDRIIPIATEGEREAVAAEVAFRKMDSRQQVLPHARRAFRRFVGGREEGDRLVEPSPIGGLGENRAGEERQPEMEVATRR